MSSNVMRRVQWILAAGVVCGIMTVAQADDAGRLARRRTPVVDVFETCKDAVVNITATQVFETTVPSFGLFDFFESPRPQGRTRRYTSTSLGSGFVLHADGYVVTNAHVVAQAASLKVVFADNSEHDAELVAIDESNDLAVLKVRDKVDFPALTLGRSDDLLIGETVIAIGNPLGYQHTVTSGIVSAADREVRVRDDRVLEGLIQTDASINKGNSGGPLLNALGELIGINTAIRGDAQNIGFAIPVDTLRKILPDMLSIERRKRLNIGLRLSWRGKVYITEATGPAAEAGIEPGDILLSVNDLPIVQDIDYHILMLRVDASDELRLQLQRNDESIRATIRPKAIPVPNGRQLMREKFGLTVRQLEPRESKALDLTGGIVITAVEPGSPADRTGFKPGMVVVQIGQQLPTDLDDVGLLLEHVQPGDQVGFRVWAIRSNFISIYTATMIAR